MKTDHWVNGYLAGEYEKTPEELPETLNECTDFINAFKYGAAGFPEYNDLEKYLKKICGKEFAKKIKNYKLI